MARLMAAPWGREGALFPAAGWCAVLALLGELGLRWGTQGLPYFFNACCVHQVPNWFSLGWMLPFVP